MAKLGDCFSIIRNGASIKQFDGAGGLPITRIETIANRAVDRNKFGYADIFDEKKFADFYLKDGDILMSHINSEKHLGKSALYISESKEEKIIHGMNLLMLRAKSEVILPQYAICFFESSYFKRQLLNITKKSVNQASFNVTSLKTLEIMLPSLEEQKLVAEKLSLVKLLIAKKNQELELLNELVKSRFVEMFGDPTENPNGWIKLTVKEAVKQGYIARPLDGNHGEKHPKGEDYVSEGVPFLMAQDLKDKRVDFNNCHFITEKQASTLKKGWAQTGDVLITHKGTIGRVAIVQSSEYEKMLLTPQITYYRCLNGIDNEYLAEYFTTRFFVEQLDRLTTGATRACVTITQQENLELIFPPIPMQRKFVKFVNQVDKSKLAVQKSLEQLEILKKSLMQAYFG